MAPFVLFITLATILALVTAQSGTGTGTGFPFPSGTLGARYPLPNATFPVGPTATASSIFIAPRGLEPRAPYPIAGSTGLPGTGTGTGFALPTGYPKRMEMRGLKRVRGENNEGKKKRAARWW